MAATGTAALLGCWLLLSCRAGELPPPVLSVDPGSGSVGGPVSLRCHVPPVSMWVQLWFNGTLRVNRIKRDQDPTTEFSIKRTQIWDQGEYRCRYQVPDPLWTSNMSEPVWLELSVPPLIPAVSLVLLVLRFGAAVVVFILGLFFIIDGRGLWGRRRGLPPEAPKSIQPQVPHMDPELVTYSELPAAPHVQPHSDPITPQSPVVYSQVSTATP